MTEESEAKLRDVLVISGNAAISAALAAHDLNVIPVDPAETPGWPDRAAAAHLLVLDLGDADRAVDALAALRSRAVDVPALVVAESVTDSPRLVSLRLADQNVKTLSWPLTPERLVRAVERAMSPDDREPEPTPAPSPTSTAKDRSGVQWPTFDPESFEQSSNLDWRTAFTDALDPRPSVEYRGEMLPPAAAVRDDLAPPPVTFRPEPPRAAAPPPARPAPAVPPAQPMPPSPFQSPTAKAPPPAPVARPIADLDLPPAPSDEHRKHRLAPWARPRPGAVSRTDGPPARPGFDGRPGAAPTGPPPSADVRPSVAPQVPQPSIAPPPVAPPPIAQPPIAPLPAPAPRVREERSAARAAEKAREAAEKMQAKAAAAADKEAVRARAAAEKEAARARAIAEKEAARAARDRSEPTLPVFAASAPEVVEQVRLIPAAPTKAELRAAAEAERAEQARLEAEAKAAERAAAEAARAAKARTEAEAKAAVEAAKVAEAEARQRARDEAEAARAAERAAEAEAKQRARYEAEAAKAAERAAAIAAKAAAEKAAADARSAAEAEKAFERARVEAARIAEATARAEERALREQIEADTKLAQEAARHAERSAAEIARADERARQIAEREAAAQAKIDSRLAAEAARAARLQAEVEAHEAEVRSREEAEQARIAARIAAEASRVQTIARVEEAAQHTKIRAEADRIVGEAVRKAEEDFSARALANRPVYYGPELEPPGIGYVHQLMAMTESLASPAAIAEELALVAMEHLGCEAVAVMVPDGDCWATASGIGVVRSDLRYRLAEEHWFVRHVLGEDEIVLIDDPEALRDELSGVPLAAWRYLVGVPLTEANSMLIGASSRNGFSADAAADFADAITEFVAELAESLSTRDVARQIHGRGGGHRR